MSRSQILVEYRNDTLMVSWDGAQASAPILVDGESTPFQTADARHRTIEAVRLACRWAWPEAGHEAWADGGGAWEAMAYETLDDDAIEVEAD